MKKFSKGVTALALTGSLLLTPMSAYAANDDITGHMFEPQMRILIERGIMSGEGNGIYSPDRAVTRAEFATLVAKSLQLPQADSQFTDVPKTHMLYDGVSRAAGAKILSGRGNDIFAPEDKITREEMAIMISNALAYKNINIPLQPLTFVDKDAITYKEHVQVVTSAGIVKGDDKNNFLPKVTATRGTASAFLSGMLQVIDNNGAKPKPPEVEKLYVVTHVDANGKEQEKGRYSTYEEAVAAAQAGGVKAVKHKDEYVWIQDGYAVAKKTAGNAINLYRNDLKTVTNYISYGTELKVVSIEGNAVKVQLSNTEGYVKKDEITLFPAEVMKLSSYYVNAQDGYLYHRYYNHYASKPDYTGYRYGKAPSFLKPGQFVYSVDGKTFGEQSFYQYFNYISLRTKTEYTGEDLDNYLKQVRPNSPLIGLGKTFKEVESKYNVNALFLFSLAMHESQYGESTLAREKNNLFGLNATDANPHEDAKKYDSKEACIEDAAKVYMNEGYLNPKHWRYNAAYTGNKAFGLNVKYASDPYWGQKIAGHMLRVDTALGGKEYNSYKLAKVLTQTDVKKNPNGTKLYTVRPDAVVTVVGEETIGGQTWLQVISDDPAATIGYILKGNVEYVAH
ncbi:glucosaminidase [Bacillus manliponensis]|uniref:Glucosaminidase n=1 Tax=Bacillus manliponensis TaxID=574376 RepID=A0A073JXY3_9BACI|nr:S-layer homology domain-containing protein [Bacillus manliponensis]KEK19145.1 glucosaminidase [Bacillus manliponensis]